MRIAYLALIELDIPNACLIHSREISEQMVELGHEVDMFLPLPLKPQKWQGMKHHWIRFWGFDAWRRWAFLIQLCFRLWKEHRRKAFDCIYMRELPDTLLIVSSCRLLKLPIVVELNGWLLDELKMAKASKKELSYAEAQQKRLFTNAAGVISSTRGNANNVIKYYNIPKSRVTVQELGVNISMFSHIEKVDARKKLGLDYNTPTVLFTGSFHPHHDLRTLIFAVADARNIIPDLHLILVGDGAERMNAEQWVYEAGIEKHVLFTGSQPYETMPVWLAASDIFVVPLLTRRVELQEGCFVTKLWEGMAARIPVIITDLPEMDSYQRLEGKVTIIPPEDKKMMANAIVEQLSVDVKKNKGQLLSAYNYVCEERSWRKEAEQTMEFIVKRLVG